MTGRNNQFRLKSKLISSGNRLAADYTRRALFGNFGLFWAIRVQKNRAEADTS
jgi:hypothetical protein